MGSTCLTEITNSVCFLSLFVIYSKQILSQKGTFLIKEDMQDFRILPMCIQTSQK